jgi:hypothetical protein
LTIAGLVTSLLIGLHGVWSSDGYRVNLLSSITGFFAVLLVGAPLLERFTERAEHLRTRTSRVELAEAVAKSSSSVVLATEGLLQPPFVPLYE